ncbi:MAG TPA: hypothetical protein VNH38_08715 [Candidatus Dormibacteraeota bacterium]|nr:hypothetical protein [Candidatus Dormibacteraeota bacterium]
MPKQSKPAAEVEDPVRYGEAEGGGCDQSGCENQEAFRCLYRDRRAVDCSWVACKAHLKVVGRRAYCLRHASIVEVLTMAIAQGTQVLPPDLDNRCASLVMWVSRDLDEPVLDRLVRWGDSNMSIINDPSIRYTRPDQLRKEAGHWERIWALANRTGILLRVALRVEDSRPETVILTGGTTHLVSTIPPWIQRHLSGESNRTSPSDLVERLAFQQQMLLALDTYVEKYGVSFPNLLIPTRV